MASRPKLVAWETGPCTGCHSGRPGAWNPPRGTPPTVAAINGSEYLVEPPTAWTAGDWVPVEGHAAYWTGSQFAFYTTSAGMPGTYAPPGFLPATPALLQTMGVYAVPATAWTTGQYMPTGDTVGAYWNGTAWIAGHAP
jgi:hypothetical protein